MTTSRILNCFVRAFSFRWITFQIISGLSRFWFLFNTWRLWWFLKFRHWTSWFATSCRVCSPAARVWASGWSLTRIGQWNSRRFLIHWSHRIGLFEFFRFGVMHKRYPPGNLSNFKGRRTYKKNWTIVPGIWGLIVKWMVNLFIHKNHTHYNMICDVMLSNIKIRWTWIEMHVLLKINNWDAQVPHCSLVFQRI